LISRIRRKLQSIFFPVKLSGSNTLENHGFLENVEFDVIGSNNTIIIGKDCQILNLKIYIRGNGHRLLIQDCVQIKQGLIWFEDTDNLIQIGRNTTIEGAHIAVTEANHSIIIGEDCMFSHGIGIRNGDSHSIISNETNERINPAENIELKNHVWIGADVTILKGVTIEENSIIGTKSLVTKNIQKNAIAAGVPAKVIRTDVTWSRDRN
jgi:acetyltransferase-like isoleucine patch superfamily enzyme